MSEIAYPYADAFLADQTFMGYWHHRQHITLELADNDDDDTRLPAAYCELSSHEARDLAFRLLMLAEHADHRANSDQEAA